VGEAEKLVRTLFMVAKSRQPSVIFIDEVCYSLNLIRHHAFPVSCCYYFFHAKVDCVFDEGTLGALRLHFAAVSHVTFQNGKCCKEKLRQL